MAFSPMSPPLRLRAGRSAAAPHSAFPAGRGRVSFSPACVACQLAPGEDRRGLKIREDVGGLAAGRRVSGGCLAGAWRFCAVVREKTTGKPRNLR